MIINKTLYNLYIQSYGWNKRKKEYINSLNSNLCQLCNIKKWEDVHHQNYDSMDYENPWSELDEHLLYVCKDCHEYIHTLATWRHSSHQRDMDEWLKLLTEINIKKRAKFEEKKRIEEELYRKKQEEEREEREKIYKEEQRKYEKRKKEEEENELKRKKEEEKKEKISTIIISIIFLIVWYVFIIPDILTLIILYFLCWYFLLRK